MPTTLTEDDPASSTEGAEGLDALGIAWDAPSTPRPPSAATWDALDALGIPWDVLDARCPT